MLRAYWILGICVSKHATKHRWYPHNRSSLKEIWCCAEDRGLLPLHDGLKIVEGVAACWCGLFLTGLIFTECWLSFFVSWDDPIELCLGSFLDWRSHTESTYRADMCSTACQHHSTGHIHPESFWRIFSFGGAIESLCGISVYRRYIRSCWSWSRASTRHVNPQIRTASASLKV